MKKFFILIAVAAVYACETSKTVAEKSNSDNTQKENTEVKEQLAKQSIDVSYLNRSVRPQDDFFQFSNGSWLVNNPVPAAESRWGSFNELEDSNNEKLMAILDLYASKNPDKGSNPQLLRDYYISYLDTLTRDKLSLKPIQEELDIINKMISKDELPLVLADLHSTGVSGFFAFGVGQDLRNVETHTVYIRQSGLGLPNSEYYTKDDKEEVRAQYIKHIERVLQLSGETAEKSKTNAAAIFDLENKMAKFMMTPAEMRVPEKTYNRFEIDGFKKLTSNFDWDTYFERSRSQAFKTLVVGQPDYITNLDKLIESTPFETIRSYLKWKVLNKYGKHLSSSFVKEHFSFYGKVLSGTNQMKPIKERAIQEITNSTLGDILGLAFVEQHFSPEAQRKVNELVDNLLVVFQERINKLEWMSSETKTEALGKLNSIGRKLGFPEKVDDLSAINISADYYVQNIKELARYEHRKNMSELYLPVDKEEWGMPAHMVNAYYHPLLNEIAFPAGIMQPPFFSENYEDAVNYGRIGMVIGHEFTHGFDDMGSKFAADGSLRNWWTEEDRKLFEERTALLGNTFENFCPIDGNCVNPQLTMGENIADLGGLTLAYYAYTRTPEFQSNVQVDGFNPAQRFFIAYAQLWKINYTDAELKKRLATDSHSPGMYRVNGPLMHCPEFFVAFDVKEGDPMRNVEKKIAKIW
jgi:putative endopeptidase